MALSALALVILGGLIYASWYIVAKKAGGDAHFSCFSFLVMMVLWAPVGLGLGWQQVPSWGAQERSLIAASGLLHTIYFVILLRGYLKADLFAALWGGQRLGEGERLARLLAARPASVRVSWR